MLLLAVSSALLSYSPVALAPGSRISPLIGTSCSFGGLACAGRRALVARPRSGLVVAMDDKAGLNDAQMETIFKEFDTSGDGFIDVNELQAALAKAGKQISAEEAESIMKKVDTNNDSLISLEEFKSVFSLAPGSVPESLQALTGVSNFFLDGLGRVGEALGIEVRGQWRTTRNGARYVDDVLGTGSLVNPGDIASIHFTVTLLSNGRVVQTSRGGPPLDYEVGEPGEGGQSWDDSIDGMRVGGQRRVYATPKEGDGPTARYDIEIVAVTEASESDPSLREQVITSLGGRRAAIRLLFAASFIPYFLPDKYLPDFFKTNPPSKVVLDVDEVTKPKVDRADMYAKQQLDALFAQEELPKGRK